MATISQDEIDEAKAKLAAMTPEELATLRQSVRTETSGDRALRVIMDIYVRGESQCSDEEIQNTFVRYLAQMTDVLFDAPAFDTDIGVKIVGADGPVVRFRDSLPDGYPNQTPEHLLR